MADSIDEEDAAVDYPKRPLIKRMRAVEDGRINEKMYATRNVASSQIKSQLRRCRRTIAKHKSIKATALRHRLQSRGMDPPQEAYSHIRLTTARRVVPAACGISPIAGEAQAD